MNSNQIKRFEPGCAHCELDSFAYRALLHRSENFSLVCDAHCLVEGHLLIIPKEHISCIGDFDSTLFKEFHELYKKASSFLSQEYGSVNSFEHGVVGQTVFHSHVHLLPGKFQPIDIVPEGSEYLSEIRGIEDIKKEFEAKEKYLFFSLGNTLYLVDIKLGAPRFFRDRFAHAVGRPERGNWKSMAQDAELLVCVHEEHKQVKKKWETFNSKNLL